MKPRVESAWPRPTTYHLPQYYYVLIIVSSECLYLFHQKHYFMFFLVLLYRRIPCESIHLLHILFCSWILYAKYMPRRPVFSQYRWQLFLLGVRWLLLIGFWLCIFRHFVSSLFNFICNFINISVYSMKKIEILANIFKIQANANHMNVSDITLRIVSTICFYDN